MQLRRYVRFSDALHQGERHVGQTVDKDSRRKPLKYANAVRRERGPKPNPKPILCEGDKQQNYREQNQQNAFYAAPKKKGGPFAVLSRASRESREHHTNQRSRD